MNQDELLKIKSVLEVVNKTKPAEVVNKGEKTLTVLELVKYGIQNISLLVEAFLLAGYGASLYDLDGAYDEALSKRADRKETKEEAKEEKQRFYNLIYKLKKDGLIDRRPSGTILLTDKGRRVLKRLRSGSDRHLPSPKKYEKDKTDRVIVITYDIPEAERRKRLWLADVLRNLNFNFVQKSVWIGKTKLPEDLLNDLRKLKMLGFVEIFEITKTGSLKQIK